MNTLTCVMNKMLCIGQVFAKYILETMQFYATEFEEEFW